MNINSLLDETFEIKNRYENFIKNTIEKNYIINEIDLSKDSNKKEFKKIVDICIKDQRETLFFLTYLENKQIEELKKLNYNAYEDWNDLSCYEDSIIAILKDEKGESIKTPKKVLYDFSCLISENTLLKEKVKSFDRLFKAMVYGLNQNIYSLKGLIFKYENSAGDNLPPS